MCVQLRNRVLGLVQPGVKGGRDAPGVDSHRLVQRQPRVQGALEGHVDPARGVEAERLIWSALQYETEIWDLLLLQCVERCAVAGSPTSRSPPSRMR